MGNSNLSSVIQGGQTLGLVSGAGVINVNDLVQVGGPGNEAWSVITANNAALSNVTTVTPVSIVAGAVNNYSHYPTITDKLGNIYVATPNASSQGVDVSKYSPANVSLISATVLDSTAHAMIGIRLSALSNSTFVATYVDSTTGGVRFTIFDSNLNIITGPVAVATGYVTGAVAYIDVSALSGGGFAIVYQNTGHTAIELQTYSNAGAAVLAATSVQALTGTALAYLKLAQLSNGNLVVALRTTATPSGTSFVIVTTSGVSVVTNTIVDSTATAGFCELSVMTGYFAVADMNGTNVQAAVYNNAGAQQGSDHTGASTLNNTTYIQIKLTNDGNNFYLFFILTAGALEVVQLTRRGANSISTPTALLSGTFTTTTAIDVSVSNNLAFVLASSAGTGGQHYVVVGLPDSYLGIQFPYTYIGATAIGSAAGTTGSYWPSCHAFGDFTAGVIYDQQNTAGTFIGLVKYTASTIQGVSQTAVTTGNPGTAIVVNPAGSYPINAILGTPATAFNHGPTGNSGELFPAGVSLANPAGSVAGSSNATTLVFAANPGAIQTYTYTAPTNVLCTLIVVGVAVTLNGVTIDVDTDGGPGANSYQFAVGAGQTLTIVTINVTSPTNVYGSFILTAQKVN